MMYQEWNVSKIDFIKKWKYLIAFCLGLILIGIPMRDELIRILVGYKIFIFMMSMVVYYGYMIITFPTNPKVKLLILIALWPIVGYLLGAFAWTYHASLVIIFGTLYLGTPMRLWK